MKENMFYNEIALEKFINEIISSKDLNKINELISDLYFIFSNDSYLFNSITNNSSWETASNLMIEEILSQIQYSDNEISKLISEYPFLNNYVNGFTMGLIRNKNVMSIDSNLISHLNNKQLVDTLMMKNREKIYSSISDELLGRTKSIDDLVSVITTNLFASSNFNVVSFNEIIKNLNVDYNQLFSSDYLKNIILKNEKIALDSNDFEKKGYSIYDFYKTLDSKLKLGFLNNQELKENLIENRYLFDFLICQDEQVLNKLLSDSYVVNKISEIPLYDFGELLNKIDNSLVLKIISNPKVQDSLINLQNADYLKLINKLDSSVLNTLYQIDVLKQKIISDSINCAKDFIDNYFINKLDEDMIIEIIVDESFIKKINSNKILGLKLFESIPSSLEERIFSNPNLSNSLLNSLTLYNNFNNEIILNIVNRKIGPFKDEMVRYTFEYLHNRNKYLLNTLNFELILNEKIRSNGLEFIEKMSKYPIIAEGMIDIYRNNPQVADFFKGLYNAISKNCNIVDHKVLIILDELRDSLSEKETKNFEGIRVSDLNEQDYSNLAFMMLKNKLYSIKVQNKYHSNLRKLDFSLDIIKNYEEIFEEQNDNLMINAKNIEEAKEAYLNKYFKISYEDALTIMNVYSESIDNFEVNDENLKNILYIKNIKNILQIEDIETIRKIYKEQKLKISIEEALYIDNELIRMFNKDISSSLLKDVLPNSDIVIDGKRIPVFEPEDEFKLLIHSTAAYGSLELINDDYKDSWNKSTRTSNHGICCSYVSNDNLGIAPVKDILVGFDSFEESAVQLAAPYDIYSLNGGYSVLAGRNLKFLTSQDFTDNTRHTHNEMVLERLELRNNKNSKYANIQPSYIIIYNDMEEEVKKKAIKASDEFRIPIIYLDKNKIVQREEMKINNLIQEFENNPNAHILIQIILKHENNRSGYLASNKDIVSKFFPTEKIDMLIEAFISNLNNGPISEIEVLLSFLEKEEKKYIAYKETSKRTNEIDINIGKYKNMLTSLKLGYNMEGVEHESEYKRAI